MEDQSSVMQKRSVACIVSIDDIQSGEYVKQEGLTPNFVLTKRGKISRANIIGVVVTKEMNEGFDRVIIDDSTNTIPLRSFEDKKILQKINVGDVVLVVGKPRDYNNEKYILLEIAKVLTNKKWAVVRQKELQILNTLPQESVLTNDPKEIKKVEEIIPPLSQEPQTTQIKEESSKSNPYELVLNMIKNSDEGFGISFEDVISNSKIEDCEKIINNLLEEGEIFEIRPGILKVL